MTLRQREFVISDGLYHQTELRLVDDDGPGEGASIRKGETIICEAGHEIADLAGHLYPLQKVTADLVTNVRPFQTVRYGAPMRCVCGRIYGGKIERGRQGSIVETIFGINIKGRGPVAPEALA